MRRLLFSLLAMSFMGVLMGCQTANCGCGSRNICGTHGVCDCSSDYDDNCAYRAPWAHQGAPSTDSAAPSSPTPMPEIREALPNAPKKL